MTVGLMQIQSEQRTTLQTGLYSHGLRLSVASRPREKKPALEKALHNDSV